MNENRKIPAEKTKNGQVPVNPWTEKAISEGEEKFHEIFDKINDAIHIHEVLENGLPGRFVEVNEVACRMLQYTREELLQHGPLDFVTDYHSRPLADIVQELATRGSSLFETEHRKKDGTIIPVEVNAHVIQFGGKRRVLSVVRDITGRKRAEEALREIEQKYHDIVDNATDLIQSVTPEGKIIYVNQAWMKTLGYSETDIAHISLKDVIHTDSLSHCMVAFKRLLSGEDIGTIEAVFISKDGKKISVEGNVNCRFINGKPAYTRGIFRDVTERKGAEDNLKKSDERFRTMADWTYDMEYWIDQNKDVVYVSPSVERITGFSAGELIADKGLIDRIVHPDDRALWEGHNQLHTQDKEGKKTLEVEFRINAKDGSMRWIGHTCRAIFADDGTWAGRRVSNRDITERKLAEKVLRESEEKYHSVVAVMSEGIVLQDVDGIIRACNASAERILGLTQDQMMGRTSVDPRWHAVHEDDSPFPGEMHPAMVTLKTGKPCSNVIMGVHKPDGSLTWISINSQPIFYGDEIKPSAVVTSFSDITGRKQMEKVVLASLKEKEILLKEIHHRVKNNLQIIASLLSLQSRYVTDENVLSALKESQNRVKAMALVHERLYRSENLSEVALSDYLQFLVDNLFRFYGANPQKVRLAFDAGDVRVDINKAIPIGLIINELVSNSLKHAFPEGRKGELNISIRQDESALVLTVHDNGPGIPADFDWRNAKSLGLRLVISLVDQLNGTIELDRTAGTAFTIVVKEKQ